MYYTEFFLYALAIHTLVGVPVYCGLLVVVWSTIFLWRHMVKSFLIYFLNIRSQKFMNFVTFTVAIICVLFFVYLYNTMEFIQVIAENIIFALLLTSPTFLICTVFLWIFSFLWVFAKYKYNGSFVLSGLERRLFKYIKFATLNFTILFIVLLIYSYYQ